MAPRVWVHFTAAVAACVAAVVLLAGCEQREIPPEPPPARENLRTSPHTTVVAALAALEKGDYGQFPALVGLALTLKPSVERSAGTEGAILEDGDFERVREILKAACDAVPRISGNGKVAAYKLAGHGLAHDELHLFRLRDKWYFIVD
ncbi:MAG: hypothetical protein HKN82_16760 [Akkermansiaceae bacterium]|nr:hypothetical protein [Akkermansiaceae bacterium]NNM30112.1 hypothetical protein [Akkermansiaceae bacterium]